MAHFRWVLCYDNMSSVIFAQKLHVYILLRRRLTWLLVKSFISFRRHNYMFCFHRLVCFVCTLLMFPWYSLCFVTFYSCQERTQYICAWQLNVSHGKQRTRSLTWCWIIKSSVCPPNFEYRRRVVLYPIFLSRWIKFWVEFWLIYIHKNQNTKIAFTGRWNFVNRKMFIPKDISFGMSRNMKLHFPTRYNYCSRRNYRHKQKLINWI